MGYNNAVLFASNSFGIAFKPSPIANFSFNVALSKPATKLGAPDTKGNVNIVTVYENFIRTQSTISQVL